VLNVEDWAEIRRLHRAEGMPIKAIARKLGLGRNTVRRALASEGPPRYSRPAKASIVDGVEPQIRELLAQWPTTRHGAAAGHGHGEITRPDHHSCWSPLKSVTGQSHQIVATRHGVSELA
jgi:transposase